jgi:hypothetical protein
MSFENKKNKILCLAHSDEKAILSDPNQLGKWSEGFL